MLSPVNLNLVDVKAQGQSKVSHFDCYVWVNANGKAAITLASKAQQEYSQYIAVLLCIPSNGGPWLAEQTVFVWEWEEHLTPVTSFPILLHLPEEMIQS